MVKCINIFIGLIYICLNPLFSQKSWPEYDEEEIRSMEDWLLWDAKQETKLYQSKDGHLVLTNGLVSRTFTMEPNGATIGLKHLQSGETFLRSVRPEAEITIDGIRLPVGGLTGQPIHNYLLPEWLKEMKADPRSFKLVDQRLEDTKPRFPWKKRLEWMPRDMPWPAPGKELIFAYQLDDPAIESLNREMKLDDRRVVLYADEFTSLKNDWALAISDADSRNSFMNEGKPGEIMALANTSVFAEQKVPEGVKVFLVRIHPGTDHSNSWGPGMGLEFHDRTIKINLRPGNQQIGFYDGDQEYLVPDIAMDRPIWLRMEIQGELMVASFSYGRNVWQNVGEISLQDGYPDKVRVGKMNKTGGSGDYALPGKRGRSKIEEFYMLGEVPRKITLLNQEKLEYLKEVTVEVHYELYDGLPVFSKWITVQNNSDRTIQLNNFKSEILAATEPESTVDNRDHWMLPNITIETDYNFGGMSSENVLHSSIVWKRDSLYLTQVNYEREMPVLLEVSPKYGPDQSIQPGDQFTSYRVWELLHDSWDRERKGLEHRRMMRAMAPWVTENPILMHVRSADNESVKKAIDQCAEVGFEMVIMTFGSGFNAEDVSEENLNRLKSLADYAHEKGIALGGYSLLASRRIGNGQDVVMPEGMTPRFGNSPCLESEWGQEYFKKLYRLYSETGLDILEHDGSYPGDVCTSTDHPGHQGLEDSQWNQYEKIKTFYEWCRGEGIYLNVPDYYFLAGSNKTGMGYRETNWSLPRAQQEIIERQNIFDGTWNKTPSMGWMFVPLVQYHGGGAAATIEPLKDHLSHYEQRLANLFGAGVQACYRGPQLYDTPKTKVLVKHWVDFYKSHREVLDGDIIHLRRPDGRDWDGFLHVNPSGEEKGLLMLYNPLDQEITRKLIIPVYYTGLHDVIRLKDESGDVKEIQVNRDYQMEIQVTIPARGYRYYILQ